MVVAVMDRRLILVSTGPRHNHIIDAEVLLMLMNRKEGVVSQRILAIRWFQVRVSSSLHCLLTSVVGLYLLEALVLCPHVNQGLSTRTQNSENFTKGINTSFLLKIKIPIH
jgi:hypothetical protein